MSDWNTAALRDYEDREEESERVMSYARRLARDDLDTEPETLLDDVDDARCREILLAILTECDTLGRASAEARASRLESARTTLRGEYIASHARSLVDSGHVA